MKGIDLDIMSQPCYPPCAIMILRESEMKSRFYRILTISLSFGVLSGCEMPSVINLFSNNTATASGSVQVNVNKDAADKIADALSDKTNQGAATSSTDTDKLDKIANKLDEIASQSASVAQTPKPNEKSYRRLVDGIL